jgi:hypothetical protein
MAGTPESCVSKKSDIGDKHYLLFKQELASSPESAAFGVFILPAAEYALPLVEEAALSHANGSLGY